MKKYKTGQTEEEKHAYKLKHRKIYYQRHKDKENAKRRNYYQQHKEETNEQYKLRRQNNPNFRLSCTLRNRLWVALKRQNAHKAERTFKLLGCSVKQLMKHLESKFIHGMTWNNYGAGWHVDHIKPCSAFDLTDPEQQKECFHYTNLQPLWARDNWSKGSYYEGQRY